MKRVSKTNVFRGLLSALFAAVFMFNAGSAFAATPTLSVVSASGLYFQINVTGDANSPVTLYYYPTNSSSIASLGLGNTNSSGTLTTSIIPTSYNIPSGSNVYVIMNGQQSSSVVWPYYTGVSGNVVLSQNYINLAIGQSQNVTLSGGSGSYYISSNSNSSVASATISGNNVSVYGYAYGTNTITICSSNSSGCATLNVNVSGYNYGGNQPVTVSQSSVNLNYGQTATLWLSGGNNSYYISSNSNSYVANVTISGNNLTIYGQGNGYTNITICSTAMISSGYSTNSTCVPVYVSVGGGYYGGTGYNNYYTNYPTYTYPTYTYPTTNYPRTGVNVSGVLLSHIPYTGLSANLKMTLFVLGLMIWSGFLAYLYIAKRDLLFGTTVHVSMHDRISEFKRQNISRKQVRG